MEVQFAVSKISKYATSESGDTLEMVERPHGGVSMVLVDGQRSGKSAKAISNVVARKTIQLLSEGVRDGAAARAAHDYLYTYRGGKVSATLNILSVDAHTRTLVISRNNPAPVIIHANGKTELLDQPADVVGFRRNVKPLISEIPLQVVTLVVAFTDGVLHAGNPTGGSEAGIDPVSLVEDMVASGQVNAQKVCDILLNQALDLEDGRPRDDISVMAIAVVPNPGDDVRRMNGRLAL